MNVNSSKLFEKLYKFYLEGINCDLTIVSEDSQKFYVHASVIMTGIHKIRDTLLVPFGRIFRRDELKIPCVKGRELQLIVQYAYLHDCDLEEDVDAALELIKAATRLLMDGLQKDALAVFTRNLDIKTAVNLLRLEERGNPLSKLARDEAQLFLLSHLTSDLSGVTCELTTDSFKALLRDDRLRAPFEELAWESVVRWVEHDHPARQELVPQLLQILRLGLIDPTYLHMQMQSHELVSGNPRGLSILEGASGTVRTLAGVVGTLPLRLPHTVRPRMPYTVLLAVGGFGAEGVTNTIDVYDPMAERWSEVADLNLEGDRVYHSAEVIGHTMYLIGGSDGFSNLNKCSRLDLRTLTWHPVMCLHSNRCYVCTTVLGGRIYALGGRQDTNRRVSSAEVYDPATNDWKPVASMLAPRSDSAACALDGKVYLIGGFDGFSISRSVECYDPETDQWTIHASLIKPRTSFCCATHKGHIFVVGGHDGHERLTCCERYDPATKTWTLLSPMKVARSSFAMARIGDHLFVVGGYDGKSTLSSGEIYDIYEDTWYPMSDLPAPKSALACCTIDDLNVSSRLLGCTSRDSPELLRRLSRERPRYLPALPERPLPRGTRELYPPVLGPLPRPWLNLFNDEQNNQPDNLPDIMEEDEEESDGSGNEQYDSSDVMMESSDDEI